VYDNLNSWLGAAGHNAIHTLHTHLGQGLDLGDFECRCVWGGEGSLDRISTNANMEEKKCTIDIRPTLC